jgi:hypothetical protein
VDMEVQLQVFWTMTLDELTWPVSCPATLLRKNGSADVGHYKLSQMQGAYIESCHKIE